MPGAVHVIGAGLAGLAAAVRLAAEGYAVTVHEAAPHAGGRCRSYFDQTLGMTIDNGNHLVLSGNRATLAFLATIRLRAADRSVRFRAPERQRHTRARDEAAGGRRSASRLHVPMQTRAARDFAFRPSRVPEAD